MTGNHSTSTFVAPGMLGVVTRAAGLMILGAVSGAVANALRPDGLAVSSFTAPATCSTGQGLFGAAPEVRLATQAEAQKLCADPFTLLADARSAQAFAEGHIAGAIHLPCSASDQAATAAELGLANKRLLLVYGEGSEDAFPVAEQMQRRLGRADLTIRVLEGGFHAWREAGLACTSGPCPSCGGAAHAFGEHAP